MIVDFIREHKDRREGDGLIWGVEPICTVLAEHGVSIVPSTYYEQAGRGPTDREYREAMLINQIRLVYAENYSVYGPRKVWLTLNRQGIPVARCTAERLMRQKGLQGAVRGKIKRTTVADQAASRPDDLVDTTVPPAGTGCGWPTSPISRQGQGGSTSPS